MPLCHPFAAHQVVLLLAPVIAEIEVLHAACTQPQRLLHRPLIVFSRLTDEQLALAQPLEFPSAFRIRALRDVCVLHWASSLQRETGPCALPASGLSLEGAPSQ